MSERIKITPQEIITRNASGKVTFSTNNLYLKTDPSGELFAGGNTRSPMIYGQNTIADDTNSGFFAGTSFFASDSFPTNYSRTIQYWVPRTSAPPTIVYAAAWQASTPIFQTPTSRPVVYYDYNTGVRSNTQATYVWQVAIGNNTLASIWPSISNLPQVTNPAGGIFELQYTMNEHTLYVGNTVDVYGNVTGTAMFKDVYGFPAMSSRPHSMYSFRNPVQLSLSVTP